MTTQVIPYAKLRVAPENARAESRTERDIDRLALSIATIGLIHPLSAYPDGEFFNVDDGGGRLAALLKLKKAKKLPAALKDGAPVVVQASPALARVRSIAANEVREDMDAADTILAYKAEFDGGRSPDEIAAACGVRADRVRRLLKYAGVAPEVLAALKAGEITLDVVQAFTLSDDHARQVEVLEALRAGTISSAWQVRERMVAESVSPTSGLALFVGREAYEAAGGRFAIDLFTRDEPREAAWLDGDLLRRLADAKMAEAADALKAEGWGEVVICESVDLGRGCTRLDPEPLTPEDEARMEELAEWLNEVEPDEEPDYAEREAEYEALGQARYSDEAKAAGVAFIYLPKWSPELQISVGWKRGEEAADEAATPAPARPATPAAREVDHALEGWGHGGHADLTAIASASVRGALLGNPEAAGDVLTAYLAVQVLGSGHGLGGLSLKAERVRTPKGVTLTQDAAWEAVCEKWRARIPADLPGALQAVAALKPKEKAELLALCVGGCVDWREAGMRHYERDAEGERGVAAIAGFLGVDFADHWAPDAEWLKKGSKPALLDGLKACGATRYSDKDKRADLAAALAREAVKARWVPAPLARLAPRPAEVDPSAIAAE